MSTAKSTSLSGRCAPVAQDPNSKAKRNSGTLAKAFSTGDVSKDMMGFENATAVPCHSLTSTGGFRFVRIRTIVGRNLTFLNHWKNNFSHSENFYERKSWGEAQGILLGSPLANQQRLYFRKSMEN
jgi:hypothetical protein